jgi:hypothetical protein
MVGEKRARELEVAVDGYVDIPLRTPLPAPVKVEGAEEAAAGPEEQPMVGERLELEVAGISTYHCGMRSRKRSSWSQDEGRNRRSWTSPETLASGAAARRTPA